MCKNISFFLKTLFCVIVDIPYVLPSQTEEAPGVCHPGQCLFVSAVSMGTTKQRTDLLPCDCRVLRNVCDIY